MSRMKRIMEAGRGGAPLAGGRRTFSVPLSRMFFDRAAVMTAMDRKTRTVFGRFGAYVRGVARGRLRNKDGHSAPGHAPHIHTEPNTGLRLISFAYDLFKQSVMIGPEFIFGRAHISGRRTVATLMEEGGIITIGKELVRYEPRPFMAPAFVAGQRKMPEFWQSVLNRT